MQSITLECKWANKVLALSKIWQIAPVVNGSISPQIWPTWSKVPWGPEDASCRHLSMSGAKRMLMLRLMIHTLARIQMHAMMLPFNRWDKTVCRPLQNETRNLFFQPPANKPPAEGTNEMGSKSLMCNRWREQQQWLITTGEWNQPKWKTLTWPKLEMQWSLIKVQKDSFR